jgi:two-component system, sensor histidine kinase LadS
MKSYHLLTLFASLFLLFLPHLARGQEVIVKKGSELIRNISDNVSVLEDTTNTLTLPDILQNSSAYVFKENKRMMLILSMGNNSKLQSTWVRLRVKNLSNDKLYLELDNIDIPYCEVYTPSYRTGSMTYERKKVGISVPESYKEIDLNYYLVPLLSAQDTAEQTIYLRFQNEGVREVRLKMGKLSQFFQRSHDIDVFYGIFFGIIFMTFFYNLFVYLSFRDKVYIWYSLYVISRGGLTLANQGYGSNFFWADFTSYNEQIIVGIFHLCLLSFIIFSILFLETAKRTPRCHKGLIVLVALLLSSFVASFFYFQIVVTFWQIAAVVTFLYVFVLSVYIYWQGNRPARFYILANIFFLLGFFIIVLRANQLIPPNFITVNTYPLGVVLEIIFFFFALTEKINVLRAERKQAQEENFRLIKEQNEILEQKVKERTQALEKANNEIISQHEELQQSHEQLNALNDELLAERNNLSEMNNHLGDLVAQKTQQLQQQNQQLADYAYFNSHKVRGALARVLGLCMILEQTQNEINHTELFDLINKIFLSAKELDVFVKEINVILNRDLEQELNQFK